MTGDVREAVASLLPLQLEHVDYNDPMVVLSGPGWSLSIACPWRLMRADKLATSYGDEGAAEVVAALAGGEVVALESVAADRASGDLRVTLSNAAVIELFADTDLDPWVLRLPDQTLVGTASCM